MNITELLGAAMLGTAQGPTQHVGAHRGSSRQAWPPWGGGDARPLLQGRDVGIEGTWLRKDLDLYEKCSCLSLGPPSSASLAGFSSCCRQSAAPQNNAASTRREAPRSAGRAGEEH